ncbi:MAG: hypothetical protein HKN82_06725 [Akkermansiaceae bacterium]|nr:hypothetical protein [Akkermansiaceae bacterium]NNM28408.1 hypothetical protein [Akkermansiaceae bacterium]
MKLLLPCILTGLALVLAPQAVTAQGSDLPEPTATNEAAPDGGLPAPELQLPSPDFDEPEPAEESGGFSDLPIPTPVVAAPSPVGAPPLPSAEELDNVPPPPPGPGGAKPAPVGPDGEPGADPIEEADGGFLIRDAALNDIFQMLAKRAGKQYFHNARIAGPEFNVSGHLNGGDPLSQMEELAFQYGLTLYRKGETVYAMSPEQLNQVPAEEWHYQLAYLRPTDIEQIKALIQPLLSPTGLVNFEPKTNTIIVIDSSQRVERAQALLEKVDQPKGQIVIEVKILSVNSSAAQRVGVNWLSLGLEGVGFDVKTSLAGVFGLGTPGTAFADSNVVLSPLEIKAVLRALNSGGLVNQTSNPTLITEDNELATISLIDRVPIITTTINQSNDNTNITDEVRYQIDAKDPVGDPTTTREIGVTMAVTPTLQPDGTIRMKMRPRSAQIVDEIEGGSGNIYPRVSESMIETIARIPDGYSLVVGGFYGQVKQRDDNKIPLLGDIPIINFFFKNRDTLKETASLVFVVTPTSYNPSSAAQNCRIAGRLRDRLSIEEGHDWIDDSRPGAAHRPDLARGLNGLRPDLPDPSPSIRDFQPTLECCDDGPKSVLSRVRRRR